MAFKVNGFEPSKTCIRRPVPFALQYPLSRELYLNTMAGFENVTAQELELSKCFAGGVTGGLAALEALITDANLVTRGAVGDPLRNPTCRDFQQQSGCNQPLVTTIACHSAADCPLGTSCSLGSGLCEAVNDACLNNPAGIPNDDPAVP